MQRGDRLDEVTSRRQGGIAMKRNKKTQKIVKELILDGLLTDGGHHKQWYLEEIAKALDIDLSNEEYEEGVAP